MSLNFLTSLLQKKVCSEFTNGGKMELIKFKNGKRAFSLNFQDGLFSFILSKKNLIFTKTAEIIVNPNVDLFKFKSNAKKLNLLIEFLYNHGEIGTQYLTCDCNSELLSFTRYEKDGDMYIDYYCIGGVNTKHYPNEFILDKDKSKSLAKEIEVKLKLFNEGNS